MTATGEGSSEKSIVPTGPEREQDLHVLTLPVVKAGISTLQELPIHNHFPAYLHLRQRAVATGSFDVIEPDWGEVAELLKMPGGPPRKPNYRPFASRVVKDPGGFWMSRNLSGSYSPSSLRSTSRFMLNTNGDGHALPDSHAQQAHALLLKDTKVPAWALAAYYLRNYGFVFDGAGGYRELIDAFKSEFLFDEGNDFDILFEDNDPLLLPIEWFEPFTRPDEHEIQTEDELDA